MQKVSVITLGCPKNTVEAEYLLGILQNEKFALTADVNDADIVIIHTCSFIKDAREESENRIRETLELKSSRDVKVYVSGCLPQLLKDGIKDIFPEIDGYTGTGGLAKLPKSILTQKNESILTPGGLNDSQFRLLSSSLPSAYLKIAEGCNHRCSFCIIPDLRGKYKSRTVSSLAEEASVLADSGIRELIVIAQDTTSYGIDLYNKFTLDKLLSKLAKIGSLKWIRLMYAYPSSITSGLLGVIKEYKNICNYMDIPVQHSSKKILSMMKRPLNTEKIIEKIKNAIPEIALRTSLITGFPGETDADIKELLRFINKGYFQYAGVFEYSDQKEAASSKLKRHNTKETAEKRRILLEKAQYKVFLTKIAGLTGKKVDFLAEQCVKEGKNYAVYGRAEFQAPDIDGRTVVLSPKPVKPGNFYKAVITGSSGYDIQAEIIKI